MREAKGLINVKSLKEQVYDYLRQQFQKHRLQPGDVINMEATAKKLGISKTPLRDALIQLEMEGFVTISPRRGIFVNALPLDEITGILPGDRRPGKFGPAGGLSRAGRSRDQKNGPAEPPDAKGHRSRRFRPFLRKEPALSRLLHRALRQQDPGAHRRQPEKKALRFSPDSGNGSRSGRSRRSASTRRSSISWPPATRRRRRFSCATCTGRTPSRKSSSANITAPKA